MKRRHLLRWSANQAGETAVRLGVYEARRRGAGARSLVHEMRAGEQGTDGERQSWALPISRAGLSADSFYWLETADVSFFIILSSH